MSPRSEQLPRHSPAMAERFDRNDTLSRLGPIQPRAGMNIELTRDLGRDGHLIAFGNGRGPGSGYRTRVSTGRICRLTVPAPARSRVSALPFSKVTSGRAASPFAAAVASTANRQMRPSQLRDALAIRESGGMEKMWKTRSERMTAPRRSIRDRWPCIARRAPRKSSPWWHESMRR